MERKGFWGWFYNSVAELVILETAAGHSVDDELKSAKQIIGYTSFLAAVVDVQANAFCTFIWANSEMYVINSYFVI